MILGNPEQYIFSTISVGIASVILISCHWDYSFLLQTLSVPSNMSTINSHTKENGGYNNDIHRTNTVQTINMSPEIFEKLYLQPQNRIHGDLRRTFANPTPL